MSDQSFFVRGKKAGIYIDLAGLAVTYFVFQKHSNTLDALTGTWVAAFTVFADKAPYFQAANMSLFIILYLAAYLFIVYSVRIAPMFGGS